MKFDPNRLVSLSLLPEITGCKGQYIFQLLKTHHQSLAIDLEGFELGDSLVSSVVANKDLQLLADRIGRFRRHFLDK